MGHLVARDLVAVGMKHFRWQSCVGDLDVGNLRTFRYRVGLVAHEGWQVVHVNVECCLCSIIKICLQNTMTRDCYVAIQKLNLRDINT